MGKGKQQWKKRNVSLTCETRCFVSEEEPLKVVRLGIYV